MDDLFVYVVAVLGVIAGAWLGGFVLVRRAREPRSAAVTLAVVVLVGLYLAGVSVVSRVTS